MTERKVRKPINREMAMTAKRMIEQNKSTKEIQDILDISRSTTCRLIKNLIEDENYIESLNEPSNRSSVISERDRSIKESIESILNCDNSLTQTGIQEKLSRENIYLSQPTISLKIKHMKYTKKRLKTIPLRRNTDKNLDERRAYAINTLNLDENSIIFIDETGFNLHTSWNYGYSPVNVDAHIIVPSNRGINMSLLCAIGRNGLIAYSIKKGSFNSNDFCDFISSNLRQKLDSNRG